MARAAPARRRGLQARQRALGRPRYIAAGGVAAAIDDDDAICCRRDLRRAVVAVVVEILENTRSNVEGRFHWVTELIEPNRADDGIALIDPSDDVLCPVPGNGGPPRADRV